MLATSGQALRSEASKTLSMSSWPLLRHLEFVDGIGPNDSARIRITHRTLVHLAKLCPDLTSVALSLSHIAGTDTASTGGPLPVHPHFERLRLQYSSLDDLNAFASSLARMFPRLETVTRMDTPTNLTPWERRQLRGRLTECPWEELIDRKSTRLNSSHSGESRMPSSA